MNSVLRSGVVGGLLLALTACSEDSLSDGVKIASAQTEFPFTESPNFLIIDIDSLRSDRLDTPPPTLARMKSQGVTFSHAITPAGWTLPSVTAMLSGQHHPAELMEPVDTVSSTRTFPGILSAYGYHIGAAWGHTVLAEHPRSQTWLSPSGEVQDMGGVDGVAKALAGGPEEPFAYLLHDLDLHVPLDRAIKPDRERAEQIYDHALRLYDQKLHGVMRALRDTRLSERTVVIVLTDHGEELYDHGLLGHGAMHWETVIRTPILFLDPQLPEARRGQTVTHPVSTLDLAPTVLERAGVEVHSEMEGISLRPALLGEPPPERELYSLTRHLAASLRETQWKLLLQPYGCPPSEQTPHPPLKDTQCTLLYDLQSDPMETHNVAGDHPDRVLEMKDQLLEWVREQDEESMQANPEFIEHLKERGYWERSRDEASRTDDSSMQDKTKSQK